MHLVCGPGRAGRSVLLEQRFQAPLHSSKPYWEGGLLVSNIVNSTAGLFDGDRIDTSVEVRAGGELLVTNPSASRVFRSRGGAAEATQTVRVEAEGWLEFAPAILIPHAGSRYRQHTRVDVDPGGRLLWIESMAPGRVASGEAWQFESLDNDFELRVGGRLVARERYTLRPGEPALALLTRHFPTAYCAAIYLVGAPLPAHDLPDCWHGHSRIGPDAWAARIVAEDSLRLRKALAAFRAVAFDAFAREATSIRRV